MTIWESQYSAFWFSLWNVTPRGELSVSHDASPQVTNGYIICPIKSPIQQFASSSLKEIRSDFHHWPNHLIKL